jgi:ATP-binding cassette subfamily B protein
VRALDGLAWPVERVAEALQACGQAGGLPVQVSPRPGDPASGARATPSAVRSADAAITWVERSAEALGLEAELVRCRYGELEAVLTRLGPALVPVSDGETLSFFALLPGRGRTLRLVAPDGRLRRCPASELAARLRRRLTERVGREDLAQLVRAAGVPERRRARVVEALLGERLSGVTMGPFVMLRVHPGARLWGQAKQAGLGRTVLTLVAAHLAKSAAFLGAWYLVGLGALTGRLEPGWLVAWALALSSTVPLGAMASWAQGRFAITAGRILKQRLLHGALRLPFDAIRRDGAGALLGRVLESSAVETLSLGGSLAASLALIELVLAGWVLAQGAGGALSVGALLGYAALIAVLVVRYHVQVRRWTDERLALTDDLVERMVGHRTRLAQEPPERWHLEEDRALESYLGRSAELDRAHVPIALLPRGWVLLGALTLAPAFVSGASGASLAVAIGGILYGLSALGTFSSGLAQLAVARVAWARVAPLFDAATQPEQAGDLESQLAQDAVVTDRPVLEARALTFRYPERERMVLRGCSLVVAPRDRVLIEGGSGGGKSTLAAILGGLRPHSSGLLLLEGLDPPSMGPRAWRARVATVPQFHENHVLSGTFAFNACMTRDWPPAPEDLAELEAICEDLGLGPLLDRMPGRLEQMVGDQGWQLSHGERSRLFIARALMQKSARLLVLDESFAALDPLTLERCVQVVLARAPAVVAIAHP